MADTAGADKFEADIHKLRKGIVLAVLLILIFLAVLAAGVARSLNGNSSVLKSSDNETNQGTTQGTKAPTTDTDTSSDRTVPSMSGGDANTLLRPE